MPPDRTARRVTLIFVIGGFLAILFYVIVSHYVEYRFTVGRVGAFESPTNARFAYLTSHGTLQGWTLQFWASSSNSANNIHWLGKVDSVDGPETFREILWSTDGSLLAVRCHISVLKGTGISGKDSAVFTHAYDFSTSTPIESPTEDSPAFIWRHHQDKLTTLFEERGGPITAATKENLHTKTRKMTHRQWRKWRNRLSRAAAATPPQN